MGGQESYRVWSEVLCTIRIRTEAGIRILKGTLEYVEFACGRTRILLGVVRSVVYYQDPNRHGHQDPEGHSVIVYTEQTWDGHAIKNVVLGIRNPVGENRNPDARRGNGTRSGVGVVPMPGPTTMAPPAAVSAAECYTYPPTHRTTDI
ncbi:hypothetical protein ACLOJK_038800 [Asimina triloba]